MMKSPVASPASSDTVSLPHFNHPVHPSIKGSCATPPALSPASSSATVELQSYKCPEDLDPREIRLIANKKSIKKLGRGRLPSPIYRYAGKEIKSIWGSGEVCPSFARQLRPELRLVMGFWRQPEVSTILKAELCGFKDSGEFLELNRKLLTEPQFNRVDAIRHCILHGLPVSAAAEMNGSIVCRSCGKRIRVLPCVKCWMGLDDDPRLEMDSDDGMDGFFTPDEIRMTCKPTDALPGTGRKLEVLVARAEGGLPLWHPDDPRLDVLKSRQWWHHD